MRAVLQVLLIYPSPIPPGLPGSDPVFYLIYQEPLRKPSGTEAEALPGRQRPPSALEGRGNGQHPVQTDHDTDTRGHCLLFILLGLGLLPPQEVTPRSSEDLGKHQ